MRASNHSAIRNKLTEQPDGLTVRLLAQTLGLTEVSVRRSLYSMPDVYIDRWTESAAVGSGRKHAAVYCAVFVPENAPRPDGKRKP